MDFYGLSIAFVEGTGALKVRAYLAHRKLQFKVLQKETRTRNP